MTWREIWIDPKTNRIRCGWRVLVFLLITFSALLLLLGTLELWYTSLPIPKDIHFFTDLLFQGILIAAAFIGVGLWALRTLDRLPSVTFGLPTKGSWPQALGIGLTLGVGLITLLLMACWATGYAKFTWHSPDKHGMQLLGIAFVSLLIYAVAEESIFRGYLFQTLLRGIGPLATLFLTSLVFALGHLDNPHTTLLSLLNIFLAGVMFGMLYLRIGTLWLPIGLHAGWNFGQLLFRLPISGSEMSQFSPITASLSGAEWLTGGAFGLEGGVGASAMLLAVIAIVTYSRRGLPLESYWWEWREHLKSAIPTSPWDFSVDSRYYQWKMLGQEPTE